MRNFRATCPFSRAEPNELCEPSRTRGWTWLWKNRMNGWGGCFDSRHRISEMAVTSAVSGHVFRFRKNYDKNWDRQEDVFDLSGCQGRKGYVIRFFFRNITIKVRYYRYIIDRYRSIVYIFQRILFNSERDNLSHPIFFFFF